MVVRKYGDRLIGQQETGFIDLRMGEVRFLPALFTENYGDGLQQYIQIQQQRPPLDVQKIIPELVFGLQVVETSYLSQSRQPGLDGQSYALQGFVLGYKIWSFRPRPD